MAMIPMTKYRAYRAGIAALAAAAAVLATAGGGGALAGEGGKKPKKDMTEKKPEGTGGGEELWEAGVHKDASGATLPYRLLKPKAAGAGVRYPLVVFFHDASKKGKDNKAQIGDKVTTFAEPENREAYPCFVLAPQSTENWAGVKIADSNHRAPEQPAAPMRLTREMVDLVLKDHPVDPDRIYAVGSSWGGFGVWDAVTRYPDLFAAGIPMMGGGDEAKAAAAAKMPIWAFHGDADTTVSVERSRTMIAAIRKAGGDPRYTEYQGMGHGPPCWNKAFSDPALLQWLFERRRGGKPPDRAPEEGAPAGAKPPAKGGEKEP